MNEILVSIIGSVGLLAVAVIANRGRQHAKAARSQVENSHNTNFREEFDRRHRENSDKLDNLMRWQPMHETKSMHRDARITRVEILLIPTIAAAIVNTVIHIFRKR